MTINLSDLIPIRELPAVLPKQANGKRIHIATVYRWIQRGVAGICLEATKLGGKTYVSKEAIEQFCDQISNKPGEPPSIRTTKARQKQADQAAQQVGAILGNSKGGLRVRRK